MPRTNKNFIFLLLPVLIVALLFVVSRLYNITYLPIFTDEAIYIRWSQIGANDAQWRFISLVDGKQPWFTWIMMVYFKLIHADPLLIGRLTAVTGGILSCIGIGFLSYVIFQNITIATVTSLVYVLYPFSLFYDRMALYESWTSAFYIWSLALSILLGKLRRLDVSLLLGISLGLGMLNKSSGFISLYLLPSTIIYVFEIKKGKTDVFRYVLLIIVSAIVSQAMYSVLRLSPLFHMITEKNAVFVYPLHEWLKEPFAHALGNFRGLSDWLIGYTTVPALFLILYTLIVDRKYFKDNALLFTWFFLPFIALAIFGKVLYPRYILFMTMPLLVIAGKGFVSIWRHKMPVLVKIFIIFALGLQSITISYSLLVDPVYAYIPQSDKGQMINDWPSGWGIREVVSFALKSAKTSQITIYTEGTFGLLPYGLEMYLVDNPMVILRGIWPLPKELSAEINSSAQKMPTYLVTNETQIPPAWVSEKIIEVNKGNNEKRKLHLYRILPQNLLEAQR